MMNPSKDCFDLIKRFEGFRSEPYLCPAKIPTIGYGSTFYPDGTKVALSDKPINESQAQTILERTVMGFAKSVNDLVKVELTQGQFDALVDFAYNLGAGKLASSTLLKKINAKDFTGASTEFEKWVLSGGVKLKGLVDRRESERKLFVGEA